jgi:hypothetical protein
MYNLLARYRRVLNKLVRSVCIDPLRAHAFIDSEREGVMAVPFSSMLNNLNRK